MVYYLQVVSIEKSLNLDVPTFCYLSDFQHDLT